MTGVWCWVTHDTETNRRGEGRVAHQHVWWAVSPTQVAEWVLAQMATRLGADVERVTGWTVTAWLDGRRDEAESVNGRDWLRINAQVG